MIETEETAEKINEGFQDWSKEACSIFCLNTRHIQQLSISLSHSSSSSYSSFFFSFCSLDKGWALYRYISEPLYPVIREVSSPAFKGLHYSKAMQYYYFTCSKTPLYPLSHHIQLRVIIYNKCHCVNIL